MSHSYCLLFLYCTALFTNLIGFTVCWVVFHVLILDLFLWPLILKYTVLQFDFCKGCFNSFVLFLAYLVRQWQFYFWINLFDITSVVSLYFWLSKSYKGRKKTFFSVVLFNLFFVISDVILDTFANKMTYFLNYRCRNWKSSNICLYM